MCHNRERLTTDKVSSICQLELEILLLSHFYSEGCTLHITKRIAKKMFPYLFDKLKLCIPAGLFQHVQHFSLKNWINGFNTNSLQRIRGEKIKIIYICINNVIERKKYFQEWVKICSEQKTPYDSYIPVYPIFLGFVFKLPICTLPIFF